MDRAHRITSSSDFARVIRRGSRASSGSVMAAAIPSGVDRPARVGIAVGRSVGNAVRRNLVKRRLREAARAAIDLLPRGLDVVITARPAAYGKTFQELEGTVRASFEKVGQA